MKNDRSDVIVVVDARWRHTPVDQVDPQNRSGRCSWTLTEGTGQECCHGLTFPRLPSGANPSTFDDVQPDTHFIAVRTQRFSRCAGRVIGDRQGTVPITQCAIHHASPENAGMT